MDAHIHVSNTSHYAQFQQPGRSRTITIGHQSKFTKALHHLSAKHIPVCYGAGKVLEKNKQAGFDILISNIVRETGNIATNVAWKRNHEKTKTTQCYPILIVFVVNLK